MQSRKKPWPKDAIMVIAADAGYANLEAMEGIHPCRCRDCGASLHADTATLRRLALLPAHIRCGRPVKFFCLTCQLAYEQEPGGVTIDYRR